MRQYHKYVLFAVLAVSVLAIFGSCKTAPAAKPLTPLQRVINELPAVPVAGKDLKFEFVDGETWVAKVSGKDFLKGSFTSEDTADGSILTLAQTHIYSDEQKPGVGGDVGWVKTPGPKITLEYKEGPPATLTAK
jgi:hypothetical protein